MASTSKHRSNVEDRISDLPPCLISHILSFLPTVEAVRSSVLSTFWRRQWTSITRLSFSDCNSPPTTFVGLVYHVLLFLQVTNLDVFELVYSENECDTTHINTWLAVALSRHVRRVAVDAGPCIDEDDPLLLHSCTTLEVLDLGGITLRVPLSISLVSLRTMRLRNIIVLDDESFSRLVSSCPVLEELDLQEDLGDYVETINISSTTLKRLIISFPWDRHYHKCFDYEIVINAPSLQYFEHSNACIPKAYKIQNLPFLDMARINVGDGENHYDDEHDNNLDFKRLSDLAAGISSVRVLYISKYSFEALSRSPSQLPTFRGLTTLKIGGLKSTGWRLLMAFLESSPELANLSFEAVTSEDDSLNWSKHFEEEISVPHTGVPYCMMFSLEVIEVNEVKWSEVEVEIVRYFLKQANCLKKLIIDNRNRDYWKGKMPMVLREKLLKFPRSSPSCQVVLMGD